jgi:type II secretion system protein H
VDPCSGLTLIETLMVLLVMGIAATLAVPALHSVFTETKIDSAATWLMGDMRYAQSLAILTQQPHAVVFDPANNAYRLTDQGGTTVQHPLHKKTYQVNFATLEQLRDVDLVSATFGGTSTLTFGALGAPQSGGTVTLSLSGRQRVIAVIYPTGRVVVQ